MLGEDWRADRARCSPGSLRREQSLWAIAAYRFGREAIQAPASATNRLRLQLAWLLHRLAEVVTGISLPLGAAIGPGLRIHHFGGVIIHNDAVIGSNCTMHHGVTIGNRHRGGPAPIVEDEVEIGPYAQILGGIRLGRGARIGAMAVVLEDVPAGATAAGNPARIIPARAAPSAAAAAASTETG